MDELRLPQEIEARFRRARQALTAAVRDRGVPSEQWSRRVAAAQRELAAVYSAASWEVAVDSVLWEALDDAARMQRLEARRLDPSRTDGVRS
ncbi:hypothetical protein [Longimycelium tulufanense]|uniref:hypothetical protein n=1 Tax=Longimycelium tulufanense TaxID=907463 RepID=UPI00166F0EE4|nr:hypothetical protein [Longimycelium tulufanense]